jgi:polysaccharide biosynthesis/export protein
MSRCCSPHRKFGGVMSTVMVPIDYPVQPDDTIYVLERFF